MRPVTNHLFRNDRLMLGLRPAPGTWSLLARGLGAQRARLWTSKPWTRTPRARLERIFAKYRKTNVLRVLEAAGPAMDRLLSEPDSTDELCCDVLPDDVVGIVDQIEAVGAE